MKKALIIISVTLFILLTSSLIVVSVYAKNQTNKVNDLEADLTHLNNSIDRRVEKEVNDAKAVTTDSLIKAFESKVPDTIIKKQIQTKYDTLYYPILNGPVVDQYKQSKHELDSIYSN